MCDRQIALLVYVAGNSVSMMIAGDVENEVARASPVGGESEKVFLTAGLVVI